MVAAIVPWNMPQFLIAGKLAPALLAGCSIVIKPAAETAARRPAPGRDHRRDRPAPGRGQHPARRPRGRRAPRGPPRRRQGRRSPAPPRPAARSPPAAARTSSGSASSWAASRRPSCSTTPTRPRSPQGVKVAGLMNSGQACVAQTRVLVPAARQDEFVDAMAAMVEALVVGDPERPGHRDRAARQPAPAGAGPRLHRAGQRRRAPGSSSAAADAARRASTGAGTCARRCSPTSTTSMRDRPRGDLRAGPVGHPLRRRRRRRPHRQRLRLRALRLGLDRRRRPRPRRRPPHPHRVVRRQRALQHGSGRTVRRDEGERHRPRARPRGPRRLPRGQGHLRRTLRLTHHLTRTQHRPLHQGTRSP